MGRSYIAYDVYNHVVVFEMKRTEQDQTQGGITYFILTPMDANVNARLKSVDWSPIPLCLISVEDFFSCKQVLPA